jgi:four helix bundle protein
MAKPNVIAEKSEEFAVRVINLSKYLIAEKKEYIISKQIFRSGTSIGANVSESRNAQSREDFISKLNIALKEADETAYWLRILKRTEFISQDQFSSLNEDVQELISILVSIIKTTKEK